MYFNLNQFEIKKRKGYIIIFIIQNQNQKIYF